MVVQVQHNLLLVITFLMLLWSWWSLLGALGDPQTHLINKGCSQYDATDLSNFNQILNETLDDLRAQVSNHEAGGAVGGGEVVPTLKHGIDRVCSSSFLSSGKVLALVANLCSKVIQSFV